MPEQIPFIDVEFISNPEPRCPCILLVDCSGSMQGEAIEALDRGMDQLARELNEDTLAKKRVEIAVISFGQSVRTVSDFQSVSNFSPTHLDAEGGTPMGEAVTVAFSLLEERKRIYREAGIAYYRPWIFLLTDGAPTDYKTRFWNQAVDLVKEGEVSKKVLFFGIGVGQADLGKLRELCPENFPPKKLVGLSFIELFSWLSSSLRVVSTAKPGASGLALPPTSGWATIDV